MRPTVVRALRSLDAWAVENRVKPGTPDVNYMEGWLELKWLRSWPRGADEGPVKIDHFTPQQRVTLKKRWRAGGHSWLLLQVKRDWLLFDGETAAAIVGRVSRVELFERAWRVWTKGLDRRDLIACLTQPRG